MARIAGVDVEDIRAAMSVSDGSECGMVEAFPVVDRGSSVVRHRSRGGTCGAAGARAGATATRSGASG